MEKGKHRSASAELVTMSFMRSKARETTAKAPSKKTSLIEMTREEFKASLTQLKSRDARVTH